METTQVSVEIIGGTNRVRFMPRILPSNLCHKHKNTSPVHKCFSLTPTYKQRSASKFSKLVELIPLEGKGRNGFENLLVSKNKPTRRQDTKDTPVRRKNTLRALPARFRDVNTIRSNMIREKSFKFPRTLKEDMKLIQDVRDDFESINLYLELNNSKSILKESFDEKNKTKKVKFIDE